MSASNLYQGDEKWPRWLFFALALLYVLPFWTVRYLPTVDGPCHTYNAWIIRQYDNVERYPLFQRHYELNWRPYPNWISHGTMAILMFVVPPLIAEKLLVSGYVLLFLGAVWYLTGAVRPDERWPAFLAFPFVYNRMFQFGFYNFSISVALFLFVVGCWWRHRARPGPAFAVKINLLLWLCYFSHIVSFLLALGAIGVLWLATLRRTHWRRHLLHVPVLIPQLALPLWFFMTQSGPAVPSGLPLRDVLRDFFRLRVLVAFRLSQRRYAAKLAILFLLLLLATLWRKIRRRSFPEEEDAFLLLAFVCTILYVVSPDDLAGGGVLKRRLSLYPYLLLIPWLSPGLRGTGRKIAVGALALAALLNLGFVIHWYGVRGREMERYLSALDAVRPNSRVLALFFPGDEPTDFLNHAIGYKALEKGLIDWDNYEAKITYFQTRFRGSITLPAVDEVGDAPWLLRVKANRHLIDAVYTWNMPPRMPIRRRLSKSYERVAERFGGELWVRRDAL